MGRAFTSGDGSYAYEPKAGFTGKDQFVVELGVKPIQSTKIDTKTVTVDVEVRTPSGGTASGCRYESWFLRYGAETTLQVRALPGSTCNLRMTPNPNKSAFTIAAQPRQGSVNSSGPYTLTYQPRENARGSDRFDVIVEYNNGAKSSRLNVAVTIVDIL